MKLTDPLRPMNSHGARLLLDPDGLPLSPAPTFQLVVGRKPGYIELWVYLIEERGSSTARSFVQDWPTDQLPQFFHDYEDDPEAMLMQAFGWNPQVKAQAKPGTSPLVGLKLSDLGL